MPDTLPATDTSVGGNTTAGVPQPTNTGAVSAGVIKAAAKAYGVSPDDVRAALEAGQITTAQVKAAAKASATGGGTPGDADTGGTGGGSSSSGGGGSSGGSSAASSAAAKKAEQEAKRNAIATYANMLSGWGIPVDKSTLKFIEKAVNQGMNTAAFLKTFRKTKAYAKAFPGLVRANGTLRMSESQYMAGYQQAKDFAATVGRPLNIHAYGFAVKNGNSPSEIRDKLQAVDILKQNGEVFREFGQYLVDTGQAKKVPTKQELQRFIMKQGPKNWEETWDTTYTASQIEKYGGLNIDIGKGDDMGYKKLQAILKDAPPGTDPKDIDWRQMAKLAASTLPASRLYGLGITGTDLIKMQVGTPEAVSIESRVKLAQATADAFGAEPRAHNQLTQQGLSTGKDRQQATE